MDDDRYSRQSRFAPIGKRGQAAIAGGRALLIGTGALGTTIADMAVRAGLGFLRMVDHDRVAWSNLPRQSLFTEADAAAAEPKVAAAARVLRTIDTRAGLDARFCHADADNIAALCDGVDLVFDGSDNFATRHMVNAACCRLGLPYFYGGVVAAYGCTMPVLPGRSPCLECLQAELPAPGDQPTCHTAGVIAPAVHMVAAWEVTDALRYLVGGAEAVPLHFRSADLWADDYRVVDVARWRDPDCFSCGTIPRAR
ncbi:MAG: ThiF family adenylyltransferase [Planctomycetota bacterium]